jgi:hypothetical protein
MAERTERLWARLRQVFTNRYALLVAILILTLCQMLFAR